MTPLVLALAFVTQAPAGPPAGAKPVGDFAAAAAGKYLERVLKSPSAATYGFRSVEPLPPSPIMVHGRYKVSGFADSPNSFGAVVRTDWLAYVRVGLSPGDLELLGFGVSSDRGETETALFVAPPDRRFRKEVYDRVHADFRAYTAKAEAQAKRFPPSKKAMFVRRAATQFVAENQKRYGLTAGQIGEILDTQARPAP